MPTEYETKRALIMQNPLFQYNGEINEINYEIGKEILGKIEEWYLQFPITPRCKKIIYFVGVELIHNMHRHGIKGKNVNIILSIADNCMFYLCENVTGVWQKQKIVDAIEPVNKLAPDIEGLKQLLKKEMNRAWLEESGYGKVGFIDIVRKSHHPLHYHFTDIDEEHCLFSVIATIDLDYETPLPTT